MEVFKKCNFILQVIYIKIGTLKKEVTFLKTVPLFFGCEVTVRIQLLDNQNMYSSDYQTFRGITKK